MRKRNHEESRRGKQKPMLYNIFVHSGIDFQTTDMIYSNMDSYIPVLWLRQISVVFIWNQEPESTIITDDIPEELLLQHTEGGI